MILQKIELYLNNRLIYSGLKCYLIFSEYKYYDVTTMYFDENKLIVSVVKSENDKDNIKYTNYKIGNICYQLIEKMIGIM